MSAQTPTADRAESYLARQALWSTLKQLFQDRRPSEDELSRVTTIAAVAIDQVFSARRMDQERQDECFSDVKDFAECSGLYGYVLGVQAGLELAAKQAR